MPITPPRRGPGGPAPGRFTWAGGWESERQSYRDDVPLGGELGARSVQLGAKDRGESGFPQRAGVCQRESVLGSEVIGDGQEVVAGLLVAACDLLGWQRPVGRSEWVRMLPRQKRPGRSNGRSCNWLSLSVSGLVPGLETFRQSSTLTVSSSPSIGRGQRG